MQVSVSYSFCVIALVAGVTFLTRVFPFLFFPKGRKIPETVEYLGAKLPPAVIGMLVIYCYKEVTPGQYPYGVPELISGIAVIVLHLWKRNFLFSIGFGTLLYMVLIQKVFI